MIEPGNIRVVKIMVRADSGSHVHYAIRDALILALTERHPVELEFNGTNVLIVPDEMIAHYCNEWSSKRPAAPR